MAPDPRTYFLFFASAIPGTEWFAFVSCCHVIMQVTDGSQHNEQIINNLELCLTISLAAAATFCVFAVFDDAVVDGVSRSSGNSGSISSSGSSSSSSGGNSTGSINSSRRSTVLDNLEVAVVVVVVTALAASTAAAEVQ